MLDLFYPVRPAVKGARRIVQQEGKSPRAEYQKAYYLANREKVRAAQADYYRRNRTKILKRVAKNQKETLAQHAARNRMYERKRRAAKKAALAGDDNG